MEIFSIIVLSVLALLLLIANIYLYVYYSHPDDNSACSGVFSKIIIIFAMALCWLQLLLLPLDVANTRGGGMGLRMDLCWTIVYILIAVFVIIILPLTSAYNECDEEWSLWEKFKYSICNFVVVLIVLIATIFISFVFLSKAQIPVQKTTCPITNYQKSNVVALHITNCKSEEDNIEVTVSLPIYCMAVLSFLSWFIFVVFGGIGLAALPLDCIYEYSTKPQIINKSDLDKKKKEVTVQAKELRNLVIEAKKYEENDVHKKSGKLKFIFIFLKIF